MSLLDLFRSKKLPPGDPATQKAGKKLISKNVDVAGRYNAADVLTGIGTEEAIYCLLQRYTVVIGTNIPDEDEKNNITEKVLRFGKKSIEPILKFIQDHEIVGQALQLLQRLCSEEEFLDHLLALTETFDPYFSKFPDKKIQVFKALAEFKDDRIIETLMHFLEDDDDDIRIAVVEVLWKQGNEDKTREMFLKALIEANERPRVRIAICEALSKLQWKVAGFRRQVSDSLPEQFYLDKKGIIHEKSNPGSF